MQVKRVEGFTVVTLISTGGQADVYKVTKNGRALAMKVYKGDSTSSEDYFKKQLFCAEELDHSNILRPLQFLEKQKVVLEDDTEIEKNIIIMDFFPNSDLMNQIIDFGKINEQIAITLLNQIFKSLLYLNRKQILHCDIKPENILLDSNFSPMIVDFGINLTEAKLGENTANRQLPKHKVNANLAPEVKRGSQYTEKAEIFSFGFTFFTTLTGKVPFKKTSHTDPKYRMLLEGKAKKFWESFQQQDDSLVISCETKRIISNLIEPNPKRRWSYEELLESNYLQEAANMISASQYSEYFSFRRVQNPEECSEPISENCYIAEETQAKDEEDETV